MCPLTIVAALSTISAVQAEDSLRLAVGGRGNWDTAPDAIAMKLLQAPLTKAQLDEAIQGPARAK